MQYDSFYIDIMLAKLVSSESSQQADNSGVEIGRASQMHVILYLLIWDYYLKIHQVLDFHLYLYVKFKTEFIQIN